MSKRFSYRTGDTLVCTMWLTFNASGDVKLSRGQPSMAAGERAMALEVKLPLALFRTPSLSASLTITEPQQGVPEIDVSAAEAALAAVVGCDVVVRVLGEPSDG